PQSAIASLLDVQQGPIKYDSGSNRYTQDLTIHNKSGGAVPTPISIVLDNLSYNAALDNASGATSNTNPTGSPYINVPTDVHLPPGQGTDWPGHQTKLTLVFINNLQLPITYTPRVVIGPAPR
ncbi:MAG: hypothetical protein JO076_05560, partial [Verrucomicrobia bacterium]|nr:hypothetical protein [Verrucomicrobiota bacterium]